MSRSPCLGTVIDLTAWLEDDRATPWAERVARDRDPDREARPGDGLAEVLAWWERMAVRDPVSDGGSVVRALRRVGWLLFALGLFTGAAVAGAVTHYDGSAPVHVLVVLMWLVVLPGAFTALSFTLPWFDSRGAVAALNPGGWLAAMLARRRGPLQEFLGRARASASRDRVLRWRLMTYSQQFGFGFSLAALFTLLIKVAVSDLAFGWSTTLDLGADSVSTWVANAALPWGWLWPEAVPSADLVRTSRYFRLDGGTQGLSAEELTHWWAFVAAALGCYGVGLRACAWLLARRRYRGAVTRLLLVQPEVRALLDRLRAPVINTAAAEVEREVGTAAAPATAPRPGGQSAVTIVWNDAAIPSGQTAVLHAGGDRDLEDDLAAIARIDRAGHGSVTVITKAWEPPLLELHDYLEALREHLGEGPSIVVTPRGPEDEAPDPSDVEVWRRSLGRLAELGVYVP